MRPKQKARATQRPIAGAATRTSPTKMCGSEETNRRTSCIEIAVWVEFALSFAPAFTSPPVSLSIDPRSARGSGRQKVSAVSV